MGEWALRTFELSTDMGISLSYALLFLTGALTCTVVTVVTTDRPVVTKISRPEWWPRAGYAAARVAPARETVVEFLVELYLSMDIEVVGNEVVGENTD